MLVYVILGYPPVLLPLTSSRFIEELLQIVRVYDPAAHSSQEWRLVYGYSGLRDRQHQILVYSVRLRIRLGPGGYTAVSQRMFCDKSDRYLCILAYRSRHIKHPGQVTGAFQFDRGSRCGLDLVYRRAYPLRSRPVYARRSRI